MYIMIKNLARTLKHYPVKKTIRKTISVIWIKKKNRFIRPGFLSSCLLRDSMRWIFSARCDAAEIVNPSRRYRWSPPLQLMVNWGTAEP